MLTTIYRRFQNGRNWETRGGSRARAGAVAAAFGAVYFYCDFFRKLLLNMYRFLRILLLRIRAINILIRRLNFWMHRIWRIKTPLKLVWFLGGWVLFQKVIDTRFIPFVRFIGHNSSFPMSTGKQVCLFFFRDGISVAIINKSTVNYRSASFVFQIAIWVFGGGGHAP